MTVDRRGPSGEELAAEASRDEIDRLRGPAHEDDPGGVPHEEAG